MTSVASYNPLNSPLGVPLHHSDPSHPRATGLELCEDLASEGEGYDSSEDYDEMGELSGESMLLVSTTRADFSMFLLMPLATTCTAFATILDTPTNCLSSNPPFSFRLTTAHSSSRLDAYHLIAFTLSLCLSSSNDFR